MVDLPALQKGQWRHLVGNEQSGAPAFVRNEVDIYDVIADAGDLTLPTIAGRHAMVHVLKGAARVGGQVLEAGEGILLKDEVPPPIHTEAATGLLLFLIAPNAPVTRTGTIGR